MKLKKLHCDDLYKFESKLYRDLMQEFRKVGCSNDLEARIMDIPRTLNPYEYIIIRAVQKKYKIKE